MSSISLSLSEAQTFQALRSFLLGVLPVGVEVVRAQTNRVPEPQSADFVTMNILLQERLSTNVDGFADALFVGSIAGNTLTITEVEFGVIGIGSPVLGVGIAANTFVTSLGTGTGGIGTYTVGGAPQTVPSEPIAAGTSTKLQPMRVSVQLDVHGPGGSDNTVVITTLFRDSYGIEQFKATGFDVAPLYTSEPRQLPFLNGEQQIEQRWIIDAVLQCNPVVTVPLQYADALTIELVEVDTVYPP